MTSIMRRVKKFLFEPASARPLAAIRIGLGLVLLIQAFMTRTAIWDFFSSMGLLQGELGSALAIPGIPSIAWLRDALVPYGISESTCIVGVTTAYVASLMFLTIGLCTRFAAIAAWALHWVLMNSADSTNYGIDIYAHVFLFYLIWAPAGDAFSFDSFMRGQTDRVSSAARLSLRIMQLQLCLTYLASGIEKSMGIQWRTGDVLFRSASLPIYKQFELSWIANWPHLAMLASWSTLVLETGYCVFIWPRATRKFWMAGMIGLHLGIIFFLGLTLFGTIMCVLTIGVFGFSAEPLAEPVPGESILLFDGVCHACNAAVSTLLCFDRKGRFSYLPLQSTRGRALVQDHAISDALSTMVLVTPQGTFTASSAVLEIMARLGGAWPWLAAGLRMIPKIVLDQAYFVFARNRYRWFGTADVCRVASVAEQSRFLE